MGVLKMAKLNKSDKFLNLVAKHRDNKKVEKFDGSLEDYLKVLEGDPHIPRLAH
jgi:hypothetical protein